MSDFGAEFTFSVFFYFLKIVGDKVFWTKLNWVSEKTKCNPVRFVVELTNGVLVFFGSNCWQLYWICKIADEFVFGF